MSVLLQRLTSNKARPGRYVLGGEGTDDGGPQDASGHNLSADESPLKNLSHNGQFRRLRHESASFLSCADKAIVSVSAVWAASTDAQIV